MVKNKLERIQEVATFANVIQSPAQLRDHWRQWFVPGGADLILELACGRGEYTLALAQRYPHRHFIGIDIKGARLWYGAQEAMRLQLQNVLFVRTAIEDIGVYFGAGEVAEIWLPFPDPHPRFARRRRRLTSPRFLAIYRRILRPGGILHLKTDSELLYRYSLATLAEEGAEILQQIDDIASQASEDELLLIRTRYELKHLQAGKSIKYLKARFGTLAPAADAGG